MKTSSQWTKETLFALRYHLDHVIGDARVTRHPMDHATNMKVQRSLHLSSSRDGSGQHLQSLLDLDDYLPRIPVTLMAWCLYRWDLITHVWRAQSNIKKSERLGSNPHLQPDEWRSAEFEGYEVSLLSTKSLKKWMMMFLACATRTLMITNHFLKELPPSSWFWLQERYDRMKDTAIWCNHTS